MNKYTFKILTKWCAYVTELKEEGEGGGEGEEGDKTEGEGEAAATEGEGGEGGEGGGENAPEEAPADDAPAEEAPAEWPSPSCLFSLYFHFLFQNSSFSFALNFCQLLSLSTV